jgi:hypothetical protein
VPVTVFANNASTTVAANGYNGGAATGDAPSAGTTETWTMALSAEFPIANNASSPATQFHIADQDAPTELITVTNMSGTGDNTWAVTRGVEGTTPVTHAAGATFFLITTAGDLTALKQATGALTSGVTVSDTATETVICTYQPVTGEIQAGTSFELVAFGGIETYSAEAGAQLTWRIRWGGVSGTVIAEMVTGSTTAGQACPSLITSIPSGSSFDVNATVIFISTTSAVANINFWWQKTTVTYEGVASNNAGVAVSGSGPLVLTAQWASAETSNVLTVPAPLAYRAA